MIVAQKHVIVTHKGRLKCIELYTYMDFYKCLFIFKIIIVQYENVSQDMCFKKCMENRDRRV